jgi:glutamate synthase domain-containing protein 2
VLRFYIVGILGSLAVVTVIAGAIGGPGWWFLVAVLLLLLAVGYYDLVQKKHSILRNYPVLGHMRFLMEDIRPELQQYFIERNYDGRPFDRNTRSSIYQRAKGLKEEQPFGTERDVDEPGYEYLVHSTKPVDVPDAEPRVTIGGPHCTQPYSMALMNVSAMSFGALSANAITALNSGARLGGFAHDTGEGGLSKYHRQGGDLLTGTDQLRPSMLRRRVDHERVLSYADVFDHLAPGELLDSAPAGWLADWELADPDTFRA